MLGIIVAYQARANLASPLGGSYTSLTQLGDATD
jgi:hypothetical protein